MSKPVAEGQATSGTPALSRAAAPSPSVASSQAPFLSGSPSGSSTFVESSTVSDKRCHPRSLNATVAAIESRLSSTASFNFAESFATDMSAFGPPAKPTETAAGRPVKSKPAFSAGFVGFGTPATSFGGGPGTPAVDQEKDPAPLSFAGFTAPSTTSTAPTPVATAQFTNLFGTLPVGAKNLIGQSKLDNKWSKSSSIVENNINISPDSDHRSMRIAKSGYANKSAELMNLVNQLRSAGASTEIDLPRIAVIGNQSARKSSLIEAISGIKVPRDSGTCTRCPMEVRLRHTTSTWSCRISLRTKSKDPSVPTVDTSFGPTLYAPELVEVMLRKAQLAVLNPSILSSEFVDLDANSLEKAKAGESFSKDDLRFTEDLVCVDIAGPQVTDLAFVDLPGIISSADPKYKSDIVLIENLVKKYIEGNCLILCCLTMKDDLENQMAHLMAREFDPDGTCTVGVLTKADMVEKNEHKRWFSVLRNESSALRLGYFCTKQPSSSELDQGDLTWGDSRESEAKFFRETPPWPELEPQYQKRLGTPALTTFLSNRLSKYIAEKLPGLKLQATAAYHQVVNQYNLLPSPPSADPKLELIQLVYAFANDLGSYSDGREVELIQKANELYANFRLQIAATEPLFIPLDSRASEDVIAQFAKSYADNMGEETTEEVYNQAATKRLTPLASATFPALFGAVGPAPVVVGSSSSAKRGASLEDARERKKQRLEGVLQERQQLEELYLAMNVDEVKAHIFQAKTRELPLNTPYAAKDTLLTASTKAWSQIASVCLEELHPVVFKLVQSLVQKHFARFSGGMLQQHISAIDHDGVEKLFEDARRNLTWLLSLEKRAYTSNTHYFSETAAVVKARLMAARGKDALSSNPVAVDEILSHFVKIGVHGVTADKLKLLLPTDRYQEEIDVMAQVMAYWKTAFKRITDDVPRALDCDIIWKLSESVCNTLLTEISGENAKVDVAELMKEDEDVTSRRDELAKRKKTLLGAKNLLASFEFVGSEGDKVSIGAEEQKV